MKKQETQRNKIEPGTNHHNVKAYRNAKFLNSSDARTIRIMAEYLEPASRLRHFDIKDTVVFYGSARIKSQVEAKAKLADLEARRLSEDGKILSDLDRELHEARQSLDMSRYYEDARQLAYQLTQWSLELDEKQRFIVCSGGGPGIMEAANRGAAEAGGKTIGFNISLPMEQHPNPYITPELSFDFHYFFMRKFWFVYTAKALVVFPGGFGTFDEMFELLTLRQTAKITKPLNVIVYGSDFWKNVINFDFLADKGVIAREDLELFTFVDDVEDAFITMRNHFEKEFVGKRKYWHW